MNDKDIIAAVLHDARLCKKLPSPEELDRALAAFDALVAERDEAVAALREALTDARVMGHLQLQTFKTADDVLARLSTPKEVMPDERAPGNGDAVPKLHVSTEVGDEGTDPAPASCPTCGRDYSAWGADSFTCSDPWHGEASRDQA